jgi:TetR/AcrR family tetracycline transcriptional repressor
MRSLARRLGCSPMALYRHVATKQDLMRAISEHYLADIEIPDTEGMDWQDAIVAACAAVHRAILAQAPLQEILPAQHVDAFAVLRASEIVLRALISAGLSERESVEALSVITSYAVGVTERKAAQRAATPAELERLRRIMALPADEFPTVRALAGQVVAVDYELSFEAGLRLLLQGVVPR